MTTKSKTNTAIPHGEFGRSLLRHRVMASSARPDDPQLEKLVHDGKGETLLEMAPVLGFDLPSGQELGFYRMAKDAGVDKGSVLKVVNDMARKNGLGGLGMKTLPERSFMTLDKAISRAAENVRKAAVKRATLEKEERARVMQLSMTLEAPTAVQVDTQAEVQMHPITPLDRIDEATLVERVLRDTANVATMGLRTLPMGSTVRIVVETSGISTSFEQRLV